MKTKERLYKTMVDRIKTIVDRIKTKCRLYKTIVDRMNTMIDRMKTKGRLYKNKKTMIDRRGSVEEYGKLVQKTPETQRKTVE